MNICQANFDFIVDTLHVPYRVCTNSCAGSAFTDFLVAIHALVRFFSVNKRRGPSSGPGTLSWTVCAYMFVNAAWAMEGASFWLQPGGRRLLGPDWLQPFFGLLWRGNAQVRDRGYDPPSHGCSHSTHHSRVRFPQLQAVILYLSWTLGFLLLSVSGLLPPILSSRKPLFHFLAALHALSFSFITSSSFPSLFGDCAFEHYVHFGAANITPPLTAVWLCIIAVAYVYRAYVKHGESLRMAGYSPRGVGEVAVGVAAKGGNHIF